MQVVSRRPITHCEMGSIMDREDNAEMNSSKALESAQLKDWFTSKTMYRNTDQIRKVLLQLERFNLYQQEKIHLINLRPQSIIDIHLIINSQEDKLDSAQMHQVLAILKTE